MSLAVITSLRDAQDRAIATLPLSLREALMRVDGELRLHGMQFTIICDACYQRNPRVSAVIATHGADDSLSELVCACTRRRFLAAF